MKQESKDAGSENISFPSSKQYFDRRDILKGLATVPVLGIFIVKLMKKLSFDDFKKKQILDEFGTEKKAPAVLPKTYMKKAGELIRLGIIGYGNRGEYLTKSLGFVYPQWIEDRKKDLKQNPLNNQLEEFYNQEDLNVVVAGICDVFDIRAELGIEASRNDALSGGGPGSLQGAKRYRRYRDMLDSNDIDAVIIAVPEHLHAAMIIDAVNAGKHVYAEKCMTRTIEEAFQVADVVKKSNRVFQLGHQNRQQETCFKARDIIANKILGKVTLVETTTNRNDLMGAWVWDINKDASPENIDWRQFIGSAPLRPFNLERFFRWRLWYEYSNGIASDLLSHEFDTVNQILDLGIPSSVMSSGGIYYYKDGREVPDVFQVVMEYPERNLTILYSATLANARNRGMIFMGNDASMEVGGKLTVVAEDNSTRYKEKIGAGIIDTSLPLFSYRPGAKGFDAVTSATEKYFAERGLIYTYRDGKRVNTTYLHLKEWIDCIRNGNQTSCPIERGFEESITCHMATKSYFEGRKVMWDPNKRMVI